MIINRFLKANIVNLYCVRMHEIFWSKNENLFYIIYASHSKDMCAKYGRSRMNNAHTISLTNSVGHPAKVIQSDSIIFKKEDDFCTTFVSSVVLLT